MMRIVLLAFALHLAMPVAVRAEEHALAPAASTVADFLACLRERDVTLITAHRGGVVGGLPENSMEAMTHTAAHMPALMEVDIQRTRDGVLVLMHDQDVARTTSGHGDIQQMTWDEVRVLELENQAGLPTGARPPRLDQALEWARGVAVLQLDVKRGVSLEAVVEAIRAAGAQSYALVIVYNVADAMIVANADPTISMNVNLHSLAEVDSLAAAGVDLSRITAFTGIGRPDIDYWAALHSRGLSVGYGVLWNGDLEIATRGEDARYAALADQGADILVTDRHFEAYRAVTGRQDTSAALAACTRRAGS